jgi:UDP-N-acetylglucosamine diphosphorylase / glucose-1-phosphate thymidylyltransferase / UDP-N-acetylgalactosamine diphosphorylase / glucosamine-1-phosphate N-acetyltransferase / galactosamine-1-phosphate N-acetyltransferase
MRKAVILAAGRGTRLGSLTDDLPKPMLPLKGKPMLEHLLDRLRAAGFSEAFLVTGYRAEVIEEHFAAYPMRIETARQTEINGTARAALLARDFVQGEDFFLTYGDILCEPADYAGMVARHTADGVIGCKWVDDPYQGAAVYAGDDGRVTRMIEKPPIGTSTTHWNSAGLYCFNAAIFEEFARAPLSPRGEYEITTGIVQQLEQGQRLMLYGIAGAWRDVGRPEDYAAAQEMV